MKRLISLLLIISITTFSWYSCAKDNKKVYVHAVSIQSSVVIDTMVLKPSLSNQLIDESFSYTPYNAQSNRNSFFEFAIIFNEKLQQFIAFFTRSSDQITEVINDNLTPSQTPTSNIAPEKSSMLTNNECKESYYKS